MSTVNHALAKCIFSVVALASMAASCDARQRMRAAEVRQTGNLPCFSIEDDAWLRSEQVEVALITVSEIDIDKGVLATTWSAGFTASDSPPMLSADTCIPYGIAGNSNSRDSEVLPVQPGRRYNVFINAHIRDGAGWANRRYQAHFCLSHKEAQRVVVHDVKWNPEAGERDWSLCGIHGVEDIKTRP